MKTFLLLLLCSYASCASEFSIDWKEGDSKTFELITVVSSGQVDKLEVQEMMHSSVTISVLKDSGDSLLLKVENSSDELVRLLQQLTPILKSNDDFADFELIAPEFVILKSTGEFDIENWEEVSESAEELHDILLDAVYRLFNEMHEESDLKGDETDKFARMMLPVMSAAVYQITEIISTKEGMIASTLGDLSMMELAFGQKYDLGVPSVTTEKVKNTLGVVAELNSKVSRTLVSNDKAKNAAVIEVKYEFESAELLEARKNMVVEMFGKIFGEEKARAKAEKEFNGGEIILEKSVFINLDTHSGWIDSAQSKSTYKMTSPLGTVKYLESVTRIRVN